MINYILYMRNCSYFFSTLTFSFSFKLKYNSKDDIILIIVILTNSFNWKIIQYKNKILIFLPVIPLLAQRPHSQ